MNNNKLLAGGVAVAVAVVLFAAILGGVFDNDDGPPSGTTDLGCTLATSGVGLLAAGLARNESASSIIVGLTATAGVGVGCKRAINALVNRPDESVDLTIRTPDGPVQQTVTGADLATAPPQTVDRRCSAWLSAVLAEACQEGRLPPPRAVNPYGADGLVCEAGLWTSRSSGCPFAAHVRRTYGQAPSASIEVQGTRSTYAMSCIASPIQVTCSTADAISASWTP